MKRSNLRIMGIEKKRRIPTFKDPGRIFNKIIEEKLPALKK